MAVNQGFIVVQPHDPGLAWWIFHDMRSRVDEFISHANGATFLELGRGKFKHLGVRLADTATVRQFNVEADALHASARQALDESRVLVPSATPSSPTSCPVACEYKYAEKQVEAVV